MDQSPEERKRPHVVGDTTSAEVGVFVVDLDSRQLVRTRLEVPRTSVGLECEMRWVCAAWSRAHCPDGCDRCCRSSTCCIVELAFAGR